MEPLQHLWAPSVLYCYEKNQSFTNCLAIHLSSGSDLILSVDEASLLPESILPNVLQMPTTEMRKEASTGLISLDSASVGRYLKVQIT